MKENKLEVLKESLKLNAEDSRLIDMFHSQDKSISKLSEQICLKLKDDSVAKKIILHTLLFEKMKVKLTGNHSWGRSHWQGNLRALEKFQGLVSRTNGFSFFVGISKNGKFKYLNVWESDYEIFIKKYER